MNTEAIEHHLTENNIQFTYENGEFILECTELSVETLREVSACDAGVRIHQTKNKLVLFDDSPTYFS